MIKEEEKKPLSVKEESKVEPNPEESQSVLSPAPNSQAPNIKTPKQDQLNNEITQLTVEIDALKILIQGPNPRLVDRQALSGKVKQRKKCMVAIKRCQALQRASRKHRKKLAVILSSVEKPIRPFPGRPALEEDEKFSGLPDLIVRVAQQLSAADPRRRAEILTLPKTLDDLKEALRKEGLDVNRATLYTRLIPRRKNSTHGKRHIRVVPVQLRKPQFDGRKKHVSARFCFALSKMIRELAS